MSKIEGYGKVKATVASLALGFIAAGASAEVVSFSKVFTNTTNEAKVFVYEKFITLTESSGTLSGYGRLTIGVSDLRNDGAWVSSVEDAPIYLAFYKAGTQQEDASLFDMQQLFGPSDGQPYVLTAPARSNASATDTFQNLADSPHNAAYGDQIGITIKLVVSAGDQVAVAGDLVVIPVSGSLPLLALAGIIGTSRRRSC